MREEEDYLEGKYAEKKKEENNLSLTFFSCPCRCCTKLTILNFKMTASNRTTA
jgi:hypothetical protein